MSHKEYCSQCKKDVPVICGDCEMPVGAKHKCSTCGSFSRICAMCRQPLTDN